MQYQNELILGESADGSVVITQIIYGVNDAVRVADVVAGVLGRHSTCRIRYDVEYRAYFKHHNVEYYLDDFLKA